MNYLSHRFSNLASLVMLLVLSVFTAWMFSFGMRLNSDVIAMYDDADLAAEMPIASATAVQASSTQNNP